MRKTTNVIKNNKALNTNYNTNTTVEEVQVPDAKRMKNLKIVTDQLSLIFEKTDYEAKLSLLTKSINLLG